jgi:hypothetical protein
VSAPVRQAAAKSSPPPLSRRGGGGSSLADEIFSLGEVAGQAQEEEQQGGEAGEAAEAAERRHAEELARLKEGEWRRRAAPDSSAGATEHSPTKPLTNTRAHVVLCNALTNHPALRPCGLRRAERQARARGLACDARRARRAFSTD